MSDFHHLSRQKREWTKTSAANEYTGTTGIKESGGKIKILEQIVLCTSEKKKPDISNKKPIAHNNNEEEIKSRKCQICEKSFGSNYEEHINSKHELFECPEKDCQKKFKRKSSLRKHLYHHRGKFKYACSDCDETFIDKSKYQIHCASKHKKIEKTYECQECHKQFTSSDYLKKHQITHKDEYRYSCKICDQKFKWLTSLTTHAQIHTQNKPMIQCMHCHKKFFNQRTLERHTRIHQKQRFQCKLCNTVASIRKDNIMRHIRHLHTEISKNEISNYIIAVEEEPNKGEEKKLTEENIGSSAATNETEIGGDVDDETNDFLIIDESARQEPEEEDYEVIEVPTINNRVNVIQCIGNPHKNQLSPNKAPMPVETAQTEVENFVVTETIDLSDKPSAEPEIKSKEQSSQQTNHKCDNNQIQLPPKKKAIAKYDPIEQYRKILGLSDSKDPPVQKDSDEQVFPDHWRKRTSQFLFRR